MTLWRSGPWMSCISFRSRVDISSQRMRKRSMSITRNRNTAQPIQSQLWLVKNTISSHCHLSTTQRSHTMMTSRRPIQSSKFSPIYSSCHPISYGGRRLKRPKLKRVKITSHWVWVWVMEFSLQNNKKRKSSRRHNSWNQWRLSMKVLNKRRMWSPKRLNPIQLPT